MGDLKSHCSLWTALATHPRYANFVTSKDLRTFSNRTAKEGLSFLTRTLPEIGKALDAFHSTTEWNPPQYFTLDEDCIPFFLGAGIKSALLGNTQAVDCVRQLAYLFYRLEMEYEEDLKAAFLDSFVRVDNSVGIPDPSCKTTSDHLAIMGRIIGSVLKGTDPLDIRPCHGSGATACRFHNEDKWGGELQYFEKLDALYPYSDLFFFSPSHLVDELDKLERSQISSPTARVVLVPKDSRGPRVISEEPRALMFVQQGLMRLLYRHLETHHATASQINFSNQEINKALAWLSSIDDSLATLDLKDASDRVSLDLVRRVFPANWVECLEACRSEFTTLPDGRVIKLNKFAPMGSSCCFPIEALVFWASAQATLRIMDPFKKWTTYVYGDDIIVPKQVASEVMIGLESIGLLVNRRKSYVSGPFRESCGGDYHLGGDVTPARLKRIFDKSHVSVVQGADFLNLLIGKFGYIHLFPMISLVESLVGYVYPRTLLDIPCSIRVPDFPFNDSHFKKRYNKYLHRHEYRIRLPRSFEKQMRDPSWSELLRKELGVPDRTDNTDSTLLVKPKRSMDPGVYTVDYPVRTNWSWSWLGEPCESDSNESYH